MATVIGVDDTDSATKGMCTTYLGAKLCETIKAEGYTVFESYLIRLNPANPHKTRGNASVAVWTNMPPDEAEELLERYIDKYSVPEDPNTNPGGIIISEEDIPSKFNSFCNRAMHEIIEVETAKNLLSSVSCRTVTKGNGRGLIGSICAVAAKEYFDDWTYETLTYREKDRYGKERLVDESSVKTAERQHYPEVWDSYDTLNESAVCIPNTPCPVLYGIRGDVADKTISVAESIQTKEPVVLTHCYKSNQGTDAHVLSSPSKLEEKKSYSFTGKISDEANWMPGGHVSIQIEPDSLSQNMVKLMAFEPTKQFRNVLDSLMEGDYITAVGEYKKGNLKLEKLCVDKLVTTTKQNPTCDDCDRSMESAGRNAGYRCRSCDNTSPEKVTVQLDRDLSEGWYGVPSTTRRHLSKPPERHDNANSLSDVI